MILLAHSSKLIHVHPEDDGMTIIIVSLVFAVSLLASFLMKKGS